MKKKKKYFKINFSLIYSRLKNFPWRELNLVQKFKLNRFKKEAVILTSIVVFLILNFSLSLVTLRLDLSKNRAYTLSGATKKLVSGLKNQATITLYKSDNIPARAKPFEREVIDLLREFDRASGNISVEVVTFNSQEDADILEKVQSAGILPLSVSQQNQGEVSLSEIYFGVVANYDTKSELVSQNLGVTDLEYNLSSGLYRLSNDVLPEIAIMSTMPSPVSNTGQDPIANFKKIVSSFFKVTQVSDEFPEEAKALIVIDDPAIEYTDDELNMIKDYAVKGNTLAFTDGVTVGDLALETASGEAKLHDFLASRGVQVDSNLVLSAQSELVNLGGSAYNLLIPYPLWVKADNFLSDSSYFTGVSTLTFPWVSAVKSVSAKGFETAELVKSSPQTWEQRSAFAIFPQSIPRPETSDFREFPLVVESKSKDSKLMVFGSSRFLNDQYFSSEAGNLGFVINVLSDYASGGVLSGIAKRATQVYSLPILPNSVEEVYRYANILLFPLMFGAYGVYRVIKKAREV